MYRDYKISRWMKVTLLVIWCFWLAMGLFSSGAIHHLFLAAMIALLGLDLYHRENYGGTGYPAGRAGKAIPQLSRIVAVADYVGRHRRRGEREERIRRQLRNYVKNCLAVKCSKAVFCQDS